MPQQDAGRMPEEGERVSGVKRHKKPSPGKSLHASADAAAMLDALPDAVLAVDAGVVTYANHAAMDALGLGARALVGQNLSGIIGAAHPLCHAVSAVTGGGQSLTLRDVAIGGADVAKVSVTLLAGAGAAALVCWPVERLALGSEWLTQQRKTLKPAQEMARMLAHEIKNPLAGIRGAAQLLGKSAKDDDDRALATLIDSETQRILRLLDKIGVYGGGLPPESFSAVNLHGVTDHVIECARAGFAAAATLRTLYDPSLPDIDGHADSLVQAVMNLVKNAAEAGARDIVLRTAYDVTPQYHPETGRRLPILLCVEDDGPGMSAETAARLFEPCYSTKPEGEGLGLVVVSRIVDGHGGMVDVTRADGRTIFRLRLPMPPRRKEEKA